MKTKMLVMLALVVLAGCAGGGGSRSACEVFSPAKVAVPTTQDNQRVETNASGDPTGGRNNSQDCGSQ